MVAAHCACAHGEAAATGRQVGAQVPPRVRQDRAPASTTFPSRKKKVKALLAAIVSAVLVMGTVYATAADGMKKDATGKDSMAKDGMKKDTMTKDSLKKDSMKKASMKKEDMKDVTKR